MNTAYFLSELDFVFGEDDGALRATWEKFADTHDVVPHRCNGVTRWIADGKPVQRITYATGPSTFALVDSTP